jgi:hypothetical protein
MVLFCSVTAPLRARARPSITEPVFTVIEVRARMLPLKKEPVPMVAELGTTQNTLQADAPLMRLTTLFEAVISVEGVLKMNTASGSPWASRVRVPVIWSGDDPV